MVSACLRSRAAFLHASPFGCGVDDGKELYHACIPMIQCRLYSTHLPQLGACNAQKEGAMSRFIQSQAELQVLRVRRCFPRFWLTNDAIDYCPTPAIYYLSVTTRPFVLLRLFQMTTTTSMSLARGWMYRSTDSPQAKTLFCY